ncbi:MAG: hypothetical protein JWN03_4362 [Nocardia sp.]|uniref:DUF4232 domain-containing protein n=1 Tax=Nocardia sp. TaxID=1821 RepID=UPI0026063786|nr:DUF4232 domain-containing protein [Nocardia sp.]MCU1644087.1 hypothetical protein [Nocardia sp.]
MNRNTASAALLVACAFVAATAGCSANGSGTLTVTPGPGAPATVSSAVPTGNPSDSGATPGPGSAPVSPGSGGSPDAGGSQASGADAPGAGGGSAAPAASAPAVAPIAECTNGQIRVRVESMPPNKNHIGSALIFETTGDTSCWVIGFPGVDMWAPNNNWVHAERSMKGFLGGTNPDFSYSAPQQVTIKPGQPARAVVEGTTTTDAGLPCPVSHTLNVTPPDMTATQPVETGNMFPCNVLVHPITS